MKIRLKCTFLCVFISFELICILVEILMLFDFESRFTHNISQMIMNLTLCTFITINCFLFQLIKRFFFSKRKTVTVYHRLQNKRKHSGKDKLQQISHRWRSKQKISKLSQSPFVSHFLLKLLYCIPTFVFCSNSIECCSI